MSEVYPPAPSGRKRKRGSPRPPLVERFWQRVDKNGPVVREELGPCWVWTGARRADGYGTLGLTTALSNVRAHRFSWELANGEIPAGLYVCHHCDNRACVRPDHLFLGTHGDNMRDGVAKGRFLKGDNHPSRLRPETVPQGSQRAAAKLTEADVIEIRRLRATHKLADLAERFGVSKAAVCLICTRKTWGHVP